VKQTVFIALGALHGDRPRNMARALEVLESLGLEIEEASSLYETEPVGLPGAGPLLNAAVRAATDRAPEEVMAICLRTEALLGRPDERSMDGPRPIDLDILFLGDSVIDRPGLRVPHPRLHMRRFVLEPLAEIAGGFTHPVLGADVATLLRRCEDTAWVRPVAESGSWWSPRRA
jgi:2-amino-4-hydroxy-6-hydroxymethyldihydropteridine diphosphokinase